ncbi:MAG: hypothetical protein LBT33_04535 [Spirochaetia bacterium]|jgi:hypothetical protein|nr:hypothetical protein [Spirochaetia bacterium]
METISHKICSRNYVFEQIKNETKQYDIVLFAKYNNKILWKIIFENTIIEEIKGLHKIENELFCFINNSIHKIDIDNGSIIKMEHFGNTPIREITVDKYFIYILLSYYEFDSKKYLSNILCIHNNLDIKWHAELFDKDDVYTNFSVLENNIIGYTWNGWTYIINKDTGKITDKKWTK